MPATTIIGIGNTLMGDDGVGVVVARALEREQRPPGVEVVCRANAEMGLLRHFTGSDRVIVIDAIDAEAEPGAVFRFDPDETGVTALRSNNIHGMGVGFLITNARLWGARPSVIVYGIQVADIRPRPDTLSPQVEQAADEVVQMVLREVAGGPAERISVVAASAPGAVQPPPAP